jgi:hypothetical protein
MSPERRFFCNQNDDSLKSSREIAGIGKIIGQSVFLVSISGLTFFPRSLIVLIATALGDQGLKRPPVKAFLAESFYAE